nr:MBG domain-containing protein [uncultured Butyrivibrio sp.]
MLKKCNKALSILLAFALVFTMLGSDFASVRAFAEEGEEPTLQVESAEPAAETVEEPQEQQPEEVQEEVPEEVPEEPEKSEPEVQPEVTDEAATLADVAGDDAAATGGSATEEKTSEEAATEGSTGEAAVEATSETSVEAATEASSEENKEEVKENLVTVSYRSTKGGSVSNKEETINLNDESAKFVGATAAAWNDEYTFVNWTDAEGNVVCEEATFVPADVKADATFTANFKAVENIEEKMPAIIADGVHEGGMIVSVNAEEGLFPAGTELKISAVPEDDALATARGELGDKVSAAKGVDISFVFEGNVIQPADSKYVHVTLALEDTTEFENVSVLHDHEGNVETLDANVSTNAEGNVDAVSFDANQFSIFIIAEEDDPSATEKKVVEFRFYDNREMTGEPFNVQLAKNGDSLSNPGVPLSISNAENQVFIKWETEEGEDVKYETISGITAETPDVVNIIPVIQTTYYIQYHGLDDEIAFVKDYVLTDESPEEDKYVNTVDEYYLKADSGNAFDGWSTSNATPKGTRPYVQDNGTKNYADVTKPENRNLYAVIVEAYWIHFEGNGSGASYVEPTYLVKGDNLSKVKDITATRDGYEFAGWSLTANGEALTEAELSSLKIEEIEQVDDEKVLRLYAVWTPEGKTTVSVVFWQQKITDSWDTAEADRTYDYKDSYVIKDVDTGTEITDAFLNEKLSVNYKTHGDEGFEYRTYTVFDTHTDSETTVAEPRGNTVVNVYYDRKVMTITFTRYGIPASQYYETVEDNPGTQYYGTDDGGESFFKISKKTTTTYSFTYNSQPYTGTVYEYRSRRYREIKDYSRNITYYGYIDGGYRVINRNVNTETSWIGPSGDVYTGARYKTVAGAANEWYTVEEIKGLYGQTLLDAGYTWPTSADWYNGHNNSGTGTGTHTTFLDAFLETITFYGNDVEGGSVHVGFHKQNVGEENGYTQANETNVPWNSNFHLTNKYNGFELYQYDHGSGRRNATLNATIAINGTALEIYYKRLSYDLQFIDVDPTDNTEQNAIDAIKVQYEAPLASYASQTNPKTHEGYIFDGWYEDKTGTVLFDFSSKMPASNKAVYGIWKPVQYKVTLKANGGEFVPQSGWDPDEDFDADGNPFFYVDPDTEILESGIVGLFEKEGYTFTGYYYDDEDPDAGKTFLYGKIHRDIILKADWRRLEAVKVIFDAAPTDAPYGEFDDGTTHSDGFDYASNSEFVMAAPPTKVNEEYIFMGWKFHKGTDTDTYVPNAKAKIKDEAISDANTVVLDAVYEKKSENPSTEKTFIIYDPGQQAETAVLDYSPASDKETIVGKQVKISELKRNEKVTALGEIYSADGWKMVSWNTMPDGSGLEIELDKPFIAADNLDNPAETNSKANTLYAQWEQETTYTITIRVSTEGSEVERPYNGNEQILEIKGSEEPLAYTITVTSDPEDVVDGLTSSDVVPVRDEEGNSLIKVSGTNVGRYPITLTKDMFTITREIDGDIIWDVSGEIVLVITPRKVKIDVAGNKDNVEFNGSKQFVDGLQKAEAGVVEELEGDAENLFSWDKITFDDTNAHAEGILPETYYMGLAFEMFTVEDDNFELDEEESSVEDGELRIYSEMGVTLYIKSEDVTSPYNGEPQTFNMPVTISSVPLPPVIEPRSATIPQRMYSMFKRLFGIVAMAGDFDTTFSIGTETYEVENIKATATRKDVGDTPFELADGYAIYHGQGEDRVDVTELFVLSENEENHLGTLTITQVHVTINVDNKTKTVGASDPEFTSTITGLQGTDTIELTYKRAEGESVGVYQISTNEDEDDLETKYTNYTFEINPGNLTITDPGTPPGPVPDPPTPVPVPPTPPVTPAPPAQAVLGARREEPVANGQAVLGARRARTEDTTNDASRVLVILVSAAATIALLLAGKKKEENEEN